MPGPLPPFRPGSTARQIAGSHLHIAITGVEGNGKTGCANSIPHAAHVDLIVAIGAVLVFDLHHQDVAAFRDLQRRQLPPQFIQVALHILQEIRVSGADGSSGSVSSQ